MLFQTQVSKSQQAKDQQQKPHPTFRQQGYGRTPNEMPRPMLGQQPPMLGANPILVKYVHQDETQLEQALVFVIPYAKETSPSLWYEPQEMP